MKLSLLISLALMGAPLMGHAQETKQDTNVVTESADSKTEKTEPAKKEKAPADKKDKKEEEKSKKSAKSKADQPKAGENKMPKVVIETSLGNIEAELNAEKAPISVENFLKYVDKKHYDGTIFHRVISGFMIQGGGMTENMKSKPTDAQIKNEAANGLKNDRGTLAMARTSVVDSATAQFFINVVDNEFLNYKSPTPSGFGYAVFGKVTSGMDVVDKIRNVPTGFKDGMQDVPTTPVVIKSIHRK
jgi:cyclophilin family peptidyl-prolyl cis-trans isomerase